MIRLLFPRHSRSALPITALLFLSFQFTSLAAPPPADDSTGIKHVLRKPITVEAGRATDRSPVTFTNLSANEISRRNSATDLPMVLNTVPGIYSYSEAGSGLGYSYLRIRGFDQSKVAVMVNGMPLNDPESHMVYWVDLPDVAASAEDIQVQRGSGASLLGMSPFGGAVNLTTLHDAEPGIRGEFGFGSWQTRRTSFQFASGLVNNKWIFTGRYSKLTSNGYRDDSWTDLWSGYLSASRTEKTATDRFNVILGKENLGLAYDGISLAEIDDGSKYNDLSGPVKQSDDFWQPHFQWQTERTLDPDLKYDHTFYVSSGKGSYVQWKPDTKLARYGIGNIGGRGDIVRQKWVAMSQVGWLPRIVWSQPWGDFTGAVEIRSNNANHWGVVNWSSVAPTGQLPQPEYYRWTSTKEYLGFAGSVQYHTSPRLLLSAALSVRKIDYIIHQQVGANSTEFPGYSTTASWTFILPRVGMVYDFGAAGLGRFSIAQSAREPSQSQLFEPSDGLSDSKPNFRTQNGNSWEDPYAKPEELTSFEAGFRHQSNDGWHYDAAMFYNLFRNEIIPIGGMNSNGEFVQGNAKASYQTGVELEGGLPLLAGFGLHGSLSYELAKFSDYTVTDPLVDSLDNPIGSKATQLDGNDVPNIPSLLASGTLEYRYQKLETWFTGRYVGKIVLNNRNESDKVLPPYGVADIGLRYTLPEIEGVTVQLDTRVENLFDRKYAAGGGFSEAPTATGIATYNWYYPGAPRNFWIGLNVKM